jgi:hypothetical protein
MTTNQQSTEKEERVVEVEEAKDQVSTEVGDEFGHMLPLCEANRKLVVDPAIYAHNAVFSVGPLRFIDKAP